jgi:hypothetical protein
MDFNNKKCSSLENESLAYLKYVENASVEPNLAKGTFKKIQK